MVATSAASPSFQSRTTDGWFYIGTAVFAFLFCIAAFGPAADSDRSAYALSDYAPYGSFHFFLRDKGFLVPLMVGAFLAAGAIYDRFKLPRIHPVSLWVALAIFLLDNLWFAVVVKSGAWHDVAAWLIR